MEELRPRIGKNRSKAIEVSEKIGFELNCNMPSGVVSAYCDAAAPPKGRTGFPPHPDWRMCLTDHSDAAATRF